MDEIKIISKHVWLYEQNFHSFCERDERVTKFVIRVGIQCLEQKKVRIVWKPVLKMDVTL